MEYKNCGLVLDDRYAKHLTGPFHPECPERYLSIVQALKESDTLKDLLLLSPRPATVDEIALCHSLDYIQLVEKECQLSAPDGSTSLSTGDAQICPLSYEIALLSAGGALIAVDKVMQNQCLHAFAALRPPGHHAETNRGMGFCLFNNIAIAARYALKKYALERVLIVDWDVHHGNGTQEIFYKDPNVFYFSTHQWPQYPGTGKASETGEGSGDGTTMNVPIAATPSSTKQIFEAFDELAKRMETYRPELILISAGFDAHRLDPIGGFMLNEQDFSDLTKKVVQLANTYTEGKIVSILEGGYNLEALPAAVLTHLHALL